MTFSLNSIYAYHIIRGCFLIVILISATLIDISRRIIPDILTIGSLLIFITIDLTFYKSTVPDGLTSACVSLFLFFVIKIKTKGIGWGDIKFIFTLGYFSGLYFLPMLFLTISLFGLIYAVPAILLFKKEADVKIPFAPFMSAGAFCVYIFQCYGVSLW